jgi:hypothetical protein
VVRAKNYAALRHFHTRIYRAGNTAGVDVSGMRSDTSDGGDARVLKWKGILPNIAQQFVGAGWIESAGDGGNSNCERHG